jgi:A/G-specific adenine glycosylase
MPTNKPQPRPDSERKNSARDATFAAALIAWFAKAARDLPWRHTRDPYAILVSEIMLQQTQVATALPYYERWLRKFPDFATLAAASEHEVLALWQGLGYYSRARNLHRAAQQVVANHGGEMPRALDAIRALPGLGRYTAGAVATFAFGLATPIIDANIARVLTRLANYAEPVASTAAQKFLWDFAAALVPEKNARAYNGALMELGALLCTPRQPQCLLCPVKTHCRAEVPDRLPVKKPARKTIALDEHCAFIVRQDEVLLEHQTGPRWNGLWRLPLVKQPAPLREKLGGPLLYQADYPFTHHRITLLVTRARAPRQLSAAQKWHPIATLEGIPMTAPHRRAITILLRETGR